MIAADRCGMFWHNGAMDRDPFLQIELKTQLHQARADKVAWERSRKLVSPAQIGKTTAQLTAAIRQSSIPDSLRESLVQALEMTQHDHPKTQDGDLLKRLTGLPPTKALRALCILFGLAASPRDLAPITAMDQLSIERFLRETRNPYDLLLEVDVASVLDLGAGDLSFEEEVVDQYLPRLRRQQKPLILHGVDRLRPGSRLGGVLHAPVERLRALRRLPPSELQFCFWGDVDMFEPAKSCEWWPRYTIAACHAPPTPTCAYEPTRVARELIEAHLRETKGAYRTVRLDGEDALEVHHRGEILTFPSWKFDIRGPLALLDLVSRKGKVAVLSAVDHDVFWELLAQLLADDQYRPRDRIFSPDVLHHTFGEVLTALASLDVGASVVLENLAPLRQEIPRVLQPMPRDPTYRFRYIEVRRGAVHEGLPASRTARLFQHMTEEPPPWLLILVPEH